MLNRAHTEAESRFVVDGAVRVASVPSSHVYIKHIAPLEEPADEARPIRRLPDPHPSIRGRTVTSKWWPPRMLEPDWIDENRDDFDVFHLQFGFDAAPASRLSELVSRLRAAGKPIVYTAHDLRNPHHRDRAEHDGQLAVLMRAVDEVITLTPGAAAEIDARWSRTATVIPHPHVVDFETMARVQHARAPREGFRVGLHVKSLRANMNPEPLIDTIVEAVRSLPGAVFQVDGHHDVLTEGGSRFDAQLAGVLREHERRGHLELRVHDFFSDDELWDYLASLDASVLPYRFGTHSGWLEACRDLGTTVIAPTCGYYAEQGPVLSYGNDDSGFDPESLSTAVLAAADHQPRPALTIGERVLQRAEIAAQHEAIYARVLA